MSGFSTSISENSKSGWQLEEYLTDAELQGLTDDTLQVYESNLRMAFQFFDADPRSVDRQDLKDLLYYLKNEHPDKNGRPGVTESTINNWFSALNSYFKYLKFEGEIQENPVPEFRDRYLSSNSNASKSERQLISVEEMAMLIHGTLNVRDRALNLTLAKTGIRRNELTQVDIDHVDWDEQSIRLRETPKRSNTLVFFDGECARVLERWLSAREEFDPSSEALFINQLGKRLKRSGVYRAVTNSAEAVGLHDPDATSPQKRFTPHCHRHWFTTHLRRSGMPREFIQELRGDTRGEAIDIYDHIDRQELRESYLAHIPTLGI